MVTGLENLETLASVCEAEFDQIALRESRVVVGQLEYLSKLRPGPWELVDLNKEWKRMVLFAPKPDVYFRALSIKSVGGSLLTRMGKKAQEMFWDVFWFDVIFQNKMEKLKLDQMSRMMRLMDPDAAAKVLCKPVYKITAWEKPPSLQYTLPVLVMVRRSLEQSQGLRVLPDKSESIAFRWIQSLALSRCRR